MQLALEEAYKARELGEVPIGAVVVRNHKIIGVGYNRREIDHDPTAHAELIAVRQAARTIGSWRLTNCQLYVTLEPCPMCAGAIVNARMETIIFGAYDKKAGAIRSLMNLVQDTRLNHEVEVYEGIMQNQCADLLKEFFRKLRQRKQ